MNNKLNNKYSKIILVLMMFLLLSTAFAIKSHATEYQFGGGDDENGYSGYEYEESIIGTYNNEYGEWDFEQIEASMRGRLIIESIAQHAYDNGDYITLQELRDYYDVLCCMHGTKLPSEAETYLKGENGDVLSLSYPHLTMNDLGMTVYVGGEDTQTSTFPSNIYTSLTLGWYKSQTRHKATPKEAYILAEMVNELGGYIFYYDIELDENGDPVRYEGSLEASERFEVGNEEFFIVEKEYVAYVGDQLVYVDPVNVNGYIGYKYRGGSNGYVRYDGSIRWDTGKTNGSGEYPSFEQTSNYYEGEGRVPVGTKIYIVGSNLVVKDPETNTYYRATTESNNSYIQLAWWTTIAGSLGPAGVSDTAFSQEADAFEDYIIAVGGRKEGESGRGESAWKYKTQTITREDGTEVTFDSAFDIDFASTVKWLDEDEYANIRVLVDEETQSYIVGPFGIEYYDKTVKFGNRPEVQFAGMTGMDLYTDASENPLEYGTDWEIIYLDGERTEENENQFPKSNETFYIKLYAIENATKITNIKTHFRFMNAAGIYEELIGTYFKCTWRQKSNTHTRYVYNPDGTIKLDEDGTQVTETYKTYYLKLTSMQEQQSQQLALGISGGRWYELYELDRQVNIHSGKIVVEKELTGIDGEEIDLSKYEDQFFYVNLTVNGALNPENTEVIPVKAGSSTESRVYYWIGETAPTYEVREIPQEGFECDTETKTGSFVAGDTSETLPVVHITNKAIPKEGTLTIVKEIAPTELPTDKYTLVGKTFNFTVTVSGTFEYNGQKYTDSSVEIPVAITVGNDGTGTLETPISVKWYGNAEDAPTYSIVESESEGANLVSLTPPTESFSNTETVTATAVNEYKVEHGSVHVIKVLEGSANLSREYIESLKFVFELNVEGYEKEPIELVTPTKTNENGDWVWEGDSSDYTWAYGNNPTYTITEIEVPEGTEFVSESDNNEHTLLNDTTDEYEVINNVINKMTPTPDTARLEITKKVVDEILKDQTFNFAVTVTSEYGFKYTAPDGTEVEVDAGRILQLSNNSCVLLNEAGDIDNESYVTISVSNTTEVDAEGKTIAEGKYTSGTIEWFGGDEKAPIYKVEEVIIGDDITSSVQPSGEQHFKVDQETVAVTAWNRKNPDEPDPKSGYIKIIKILEDADKVSSDYVNSLSFSFDLKFPNHEYEDQIITLDKDNGLRHDEENNRYIWEYESGAYTWEHDAEAPTYTLQERPGENGTVFDSIEGPEGSTVSGGVLTAQIKEADGQREDDTIEFKTINTVINKLEEHHDGDLTVEKRVTVGSMNGVEFKFKVTLKGTFEINGVVHKDAELLVCTEEDPLIVRGGERVNLSSKIGKITWYGNVAPTYVVEEIEDPRVEKVTIINGSNDIGEGANVQVATFINEPIMVGGYLSILKTIEASSASGQNEDDVFSFEVKVGNDAPYIVTVHAGEKYVSSEYKWYVTDPAPTYSVKELTDADHMPEGSRFVSISNGSSTVTTEGQEITGSLNPNKKYENGELVETNDNIVAVVATNGYEEHSATFKVSKKVLDEKMIDAANPQEFTILITIDGTNSPFSIASENDNSTYTTKTFAVKLTGGQSYVSPEITWYGATAPVVTVSEPKEAMPLGWVNEGISSNNSPIADDNSLEIVVTNKLPIYSVIDLTTSLAGTVWEDNYDLNNKGDIPNGTYDIGSENNRDIALKGIEVYIYRVLKNSNGQIVSEYNEEALAEAYKDLNNTRVEYPILTDINGNWEVPRVRVPMPTESEKASGYTVAYDVEFVYDGQTYEPTTFLAGDLKSRENGEQYYEEGLASTYMDASTEAKDAYAHKSMAKDYNREEVNNRIQTVSGNTVIDGNGNTVGTATGANNVDNLYYTSDAGNNTESGFGVNGYTKLTSTLVTTNEDGTAKNLFKTKARTSMGGLAYPFARELGEAYEFANGTKWAGYTLYNVDSTLTELGVEYRYWYEAVYNYCLHINLGLVKREDADVGASKDLDSAKVTVKGQDNTITYSEEFKIGETLADYKAGLENDYYTRKVSDATLAKDFEYQLGLYDTDYYYRAELYLNGIDANTMDEYKDIHNIISANKSISTSQFGEMEIELTYRIDVYNESPSTKYMTQIKTVDDYFDSSFGTPEKVTLGMNGPELTYTLGETRILGSDEVRYNKMTIDLGDNAKLDFSSQGNSYRSIFVTFKLDKETYNGIKDTLVKGQKSNVAEIASYSVFYTDGTYAGKVDKDSAPANLDIRNYNIREWYEDDTDSAPIVKIDLLEQEKSVSGRTWEDKLIGDGNANGNGLRDNDEALIGGLTTELIEMVEVDGKDYEVLWPTSTGINVFGGKSLKDITGFDSTIETARTSDEEAGIEVGSYKFEGVPSGKYIVRFIYGNDKKQLTDTFGITGDAVALTSDGANFSGNTLTANYDGDAAGNTAAVYNGQDYKTTLYKQGNEELDSDAADNEARRLEVIANSETIANEISTILKTANDANSEHTDLYHSYYMFADTEKVDLTLANEALEVANMDCGLIERPENNIVLDKEISSIKLTTNDTNTIFNANYDINYELVNNPDGRVVIAEIGDRFLVANVELNDYSIGTDLMQAINKTENKLPGNEEIVGENNFRYINIDDAIMQGTVIEINYKMTALNVGEADYTTETLANMTATADASIKQQILELANEAKEAAANNELAQGTYVGTFYYNGSTDGNVVVKSKVRQVVDYVDTNATFSTIYNSTEDHMWRNSSVTELSGNGMEANRLVDLAVIPEHEFLNSRGIAYVTEQRNNLALSVDSTESNGGFERELVPYAVSDEENPYTSSIELTVLRTVASAKEANNLTFDNLAEIVKYENEVGRRDELTITGNANPQRDITVAVERDASATEVVTFAPPTGIEVNVNLTSQILIITVIALTIVVIGIVVIKKKVL